MRPRGTFAFTDVDLTDTHTLTDTHGNVSAIAELTTASLNGWTRRRWKRWRRARWPISRTR